MDSRIFEFRWKDESTPYFRTIGEHGLAEMPVVFGQNLTLAVKDGPNCAGYEKNGTYFPCSARAASVRKCEACKAAEGMPVAQYCDGFNTEMFSGDELESLNTEHYVYFALFDRDLIKVGVSSMQRGYLRQLEQGSHYALIIAEGLWGVPARQLETTLRKNGMADKVQASQKKDLLFPNLSPAEGRQTLEALAAKHLPVIGALQPQFTRYLKTPPDFLEFDPYYHLDAAKQVTKPLHDEKLQPGETVSGTVLSVKGSFLVIETDHEKVVIDAKSLKGMEVDFTPQAAGLTKAEAFQGALF